MISKSKQTRRQAGPRASVYLLLDGKSKLLALGELAGPADAPKLQLRLTEGSPEGVMAAEEVQAIPQDEGLPSRKGKAVAQRGPLIVLETVQDLSGDARQNFRMPVDFDSFVYPRRGGRASIKALDLSCGGIAFFCAYPFEVHEQFEIVIPITAEGPLLLQAEILRVRPGEDGPSFYAAKFLGMIHDEEARVREAVFQVQVTHKVLAH